MIETIFYGIDIGTYESRGMLIGERFQGDSGTYHGPWNESSKAGVV